jgi:hypothetical protein
MKHPFLVVLSIGIVLAAPFSLLAAAHGPVISYFTNVRDVRIPQPEVQNYFVVDEEIWSRARPDLGDLRIYDGEAQVQYALSVQRGGTSSQEQVARILNLGDVGGHTEFDLEMGQMVEYDRIRLNLDAKNFVTTASLVGSNAVGQGPATHLPPCTLYDFTSEQLGSNSVLKLGPSSFRYLHIKLSSGITPQQVKAATVYNLQETKAIWASVGSCGTPLQKPRATVITCESPTRVPVDRIRFQVDSAQANFRRGVTLSDSKGRYQGSGEITRVRLNRSGTTVVSEELDLQTADQNSGQVILTIDNQDDPPLAIAGAKLLSVQRRIYFDPKGRFSFKLYYGDGQLDSPVYDYARFFHADPAAASAELGPGMHNAAYSGRPDDRPWSERHNAILWAAMLLAVAVLVALAIRGLKAETGKLSS